MPRKSANTALDHRSRRTKRIIAASVVAGVTIAVGFVAYQWGWSEASRIYADRAYHSSVITTRVSSLLRAVRANARGNGDAADLDSLYNNDLTPELATNLRREGPSLVFCSDRVPIDIAVATATDPAENSGSLDVHLSFSENPETAADSKTVRIGYDWASTKITRFVCV